MGCKGPLLVVGALLFVALAAWWGMRAGQPVPVALDGLAGERPAEESDELAELAPEARNEREDAKQGTPGSSVVVSDEETEAALDWRERIDPR